MRIAVCVVFYVLIAALGVCARTAFRSTKAIGRPVAFLLVALIPPLIGNSIIIISGNKALSTVGYYIYFLGMNCVMAAMVHFTHEYSALSDGVRKLKTPMLALLTVDSLQLLGNLIWGHAFDTEAVTENGFPYYRLLPYAGQVFHRVVDYGILAVIIIVFVVRIIRSPRIYAERYAVIFLTMIVTAAWETFYIFSRTPIDRSMIGFGFFGVMVFYFSLYYRPMRLLDSMLAAMASNLPDALFFFDSNEKCIWANKPGIGLSGIAQDDFEGASERLKTLFGDYSPAFPRSTRSAAAGKPKAT